LRCPVGAEVDENQWLKPTVSSPHTPRSTCAGRRVSAGGRPRCIVILMKRLVTFPCGPILSDSLTLRVRIIRHDHVSASSRRCVSCAGAVAQCNPILLGECGVLM